MPQVWTLRDEARRLTSKLTKSGTRRARKPTLRTGAGCVEALGAFQVLRERVDELTARLDRAYEGVERDEVERERLLEVIEAAAVDTMDLTEEEQGELDPDTELDEDLSTDDDDTDIDFAASLNDAPPARGRSVRVIPIRGSAAQAKAEGLGPEVIEWMTPHDLSRRLKAVALSGHPKLTQHKPAGA